MAITGTITLNGVTDKQMIRVWEYKATAGNSFTFQPNALQPQITVTGTSYNNLIFAWQSEPGMKVVHEIIDFLLKKEEQLMAVNQ